MVDSVRRARNAEAAVIDGPRGRVPAWSLRLCALAVALVSSGSCVSGTLP